MPVEPPSIQRLPVELLINVFSAADCLGSWSRHGSLRGRAISQIMLVCRHWHDVVCVTPIFWRCIDAVEPVHTVSLFLDRSSGCTVDVRVFYSKVTCNNKERLIDRDAILLALSQPDRVHSLYMNISVDHTAEVLYPLLGTGFPALEHLEIVPVNIGASNRDRIELGLQALSQPSLRSLVVKQVCLPPPATFWRSLRVLKLYEPPETASGPLFIQDIATILRRNAALEELTI
ncbi:hypothetical protein C8Q76DRAFT_617480, partial [Earliella scabrosa]